MMVLMWKKSATALPWHLGGFDEFAQSYPPKPTKKE